MTGYTFDYVFDWTILKYQQSLKSRVQPHISVSIISICVCRLGSDSVHASENINFCHIAAGSSSEQRSSDAHGCG